MTTTINASTTAGLVQTADTSGSLQLQTANTAAVTIDSSQNVGIGTASPSGRLHVSASDANQFFVERTGAVTGKYRLGIAGANNTFYINDSAQGDVTRLAIDSSGNVLIGTTSNPSLTWTNTNRLLVDQTAADFPCHIRNSSTTASSNFGVAISYGATPNGTSNNFIDARDSTAQRFAVRSNGGIANFSANNVNLSDERLKTDILPATTYLDKICSIPVVTFKYKDQTDDELNLGVIAQEVDKVVPELVDHSGFGETPESETPYLAIYQTDLQYALMKSIQELKAIVDAQQQEINVLKEAK